MRRKRMTELPFVIVTGKAGKKGAWSLTREKKQLVLTCKSEDVEYIFPRSDFHKEIELLGEVAERPLLIVHLPERCEFQMSKEDIETVREWLGPLNADAPKTATEKVLLQLAFKDVGLWWPLSLGLGIVLVVTAFLGQDGSFDFLKAGVGALLLLEFVFTKAIVRPIGFPLSALVWTCLVAFFAYDLGQGESLAWNVPGLLWAAWAALYTSYRWGMYRAFQSVTQQEDNVESDASTPTDNAAGGSI